MIEIIRDQSIIEGYLVDASNVRGRAEALVRPRDAAEVAEVLARCQREGVPVTVTAQRTSTTAAPVPDGGWLLSTELMSRILDLNEVEGGVLLGQYQAFTESRGRLFPPDPTSRHECSVGAAIACNASGARTFRYGPARAWVEALEVVLPTGEILRADRATPIPEGWPPVRWTPPAVKTAAGYYPADNLMDLFIGQEGTLGVITRAWTRLTDTPAGVLSFIAFFPDLPLALAFVDRARGGARRPGRPADPGALDPAAIEFYDRRCLDLAQRRGVAVPESAICALFIEVEHEGEAPLEAWWDALVEGGALAEETVVAEDDAGRARLHAIRHAIPAGVNEQVVANGMPKVGTDFSVPDAALPAIMDAYLSVELPAVLFGHIGDNHLHLNLLPRTADELARARELYKDLARRAVALGGSVSAEHGIGKIKRDLLAEMAGPAAVESFRALKAHLDPAWILGRGTLLAPPSGGNHQL